MSVRAVLVLLGGVATRAQLVEATSRTEVEAALTSGEVLAVSRGRYSLPDTDQARRAAHRLSGTLSHTSAALHWGWAVGTAPEQAHVTVPKSRKLTTEQRLGVTLHRAALHADDIVDGVTTRERTLIDCLRMPDDGEALSVADSALRDGFSASRLVRLADRARGPGARRVRRLARSADGGAANPFESCLRAIAIDVPGLSVRTQVPIFAPAELLGRPDLVDEDLRVVIEADSFEWHGGRADLARDARRYNGFVVNGWLVLRFAWEDVMFEPDHVRHTLEAVVAGRTHGACGRTGAACTR